MRRTPEAQSASSAESPSPPAAGWRLSYEQDAVVYHDAAEHQKAHQRRQARVVPRVMRAAGQKKPISAKGMQSSPPLREVGCDQESSLTRAHRARLAAGHSKLHGTMTLKTSSISALDAAWRSEKAHGPVIIPRSGFPHWRRFGNFDARRQVSASACCGSVAGKRGGAPEAGCPKR
jgi:hypothetical protein